MADDESFFKSVSNLWGDIAPSGDTRKEYEPGTHAAFSDSIPHAKYSFPSELRETVTDMPFLHINVVDPISPIAARSRSSFAVALPLPKSIRNRYGANYDTSDLGVALGYLAENTETLNLPTLFRNPKAAIAADQTGMRMGGGDWGRLAGKLGVTGVFGAIGNSPKFGAIGTNWRAFEKAFRFTVNNHAALLFKSMDFRQFNLEFDLFPKNPDDSYIIEEILFQLKYAMHPEASGGDETAGPGSMRGSGVDPKLSASSTYFNWPQNFILGFYGPKMLPLFRTSPCALTDLSVEYIQNGVTPSFFKGTRLPTGYNVSLQFQEMELLTKARIRRGW